MMSHRGRLLAVLVTALLAGCSASGGEPAKIRPARLYTIEQFMATTDVSGASFSSEESKILLSSDKSGVFNVYSVPIKGGEPTPVTQSTVESTYSVSFFPKDDRILFTHDQGGNENNHLYVIQRGKERDLTPGTKLKANFLQWTHDGSAFYFMSNERDPRFFDIYRVAADGYANNLFYKDDVGYQAGHISHDDRWIALSKPKTTADSDIFLWNVASRTMTHITPHKGQAIHRPAEFDTESRSLYYLTNEGAEFTKVRKYDLSSGSHSDVESADWDILDTRFSHNGKYRVSTINVDGTTVIKIWETRTGRLVELPGLPAGQVKSVKIAQRAANGVLCRQRSLRRKPLRLSIRRPGSEAAHLEHEPIDRHGRLGRLPSRAVQVVRWHGHPVYLLQTPPGHA